MFPYIRCRESRQPDTAVQVASIPTATPAGPEHLLSINMCQMQLQPVARACTRVVARLAAWSPRWGRWALAWAASLPLARERQRWRCQAASSRLDCFLLSATMPRLHVIVQRYVPRWFIEVALVAAALQIYRQTLHLRSRFLAHPIMVSNPQICTQISTDSPATACSCGSRRQCPQRAALGESGTPSCRSRCACPPGRLLILCLVNLADQAQRRMDRCSSLQCGDGTCFEKGYCAAMVRWT